METIRIFIGNEPGNEKAEKALHYSIIKNCSSPIEIHWMSDKYKNSIWDNWNKGRDNRLQNSGTGWKTNFSVFRWVIPEICGFKGKAIYLDIDQLVLKDIRQMFELEMGNNAVLSITPERTDVMLMNCEKFNNPIWPSVSKMKPSGKHQKSYRKIVQENLGIGQLDLMYNCLDGKDFDKNKTRLVHYTKMSTQPWHPFPNAMTYKEHNSPEMETLWHQYYNESLKFEIENNYILGSPENLDDNFTIFNSVKNMSSNFK